MTTKSAIDPRIITPEMVLSFPCLLEARSIVGAEGTSNPKYSCTLLTYPSLEQKYLPGKVDLVPMRKLATEVVTEFFGAAKMAGLLKAGKIRSPFIDDAEQCERWGWPEGTIILRVSSVQKPGVVSCYKDVTGKPKTMTDAEIAEKMYPGARVRASLRAFAYDKAGNKGAGFALQNLQWLGDDVRIDNRIAADQEFEPTAEADAADLDAPANKKSEALADLADLL